MANMYCKCGETLSTVMAPNDIQIRMYTDKEWDKILEVDTIESWKFPLPKNDVWRCPTCERLYFFEDNKVIKTYALEPAS
ncbi:MAG: hypothetical protein FWG68_06020 [Defluviitaleaceae bacterium]|nr:hypothetical protein [Defluviitaleaceae bacterium]